MKALEAARKAAEEEEKAEKARVQNALEEKADDTVDIKAEKQESAGFTLPFGAEQYLGKYLWTNKELKDHRMDEKYESWQKSLEEYLEIIETAKK